MTDDDPRTHPCPTCNAQPGDPCTMTLGILNGRKMQYEHLARQPRRPQP